MRTLRNLSLILICLLGSAWNVSADVTLNSADYASLSEVFTAIPEDAGSVTILLSDYTGAAEDLSVPDDRGITDLTILMADGFEKVSADGVERICANGIPLTIGEGIEMPETSIYGGACVIGGEADLESSSIQILGTVGFVFGGGFADEGGTSTVRETSVQVGEGAQLDLPRGISGLKGKTNSGEADLASARRASAPFESPALSRM